MMDGSHIGKLHMLNTASVSGIWHEKEAQRMTSIPCVFPQIRTSLLHCGYWSRLLYGSTVEEMRDALPLVWHQLDIVLIQCSKVTKSLQIKIHKTCTVKDQAVLY